MNALADHLLEERVYYKAIAVSILRDNDKAERVLANLLVHLQQLPAEKGQECLDFGKMKVFVERQIRFLSRNYVNAPARYLYTNRSYFDGLAKFILRGDSEGQDVVSALLERFVEMSEGDVQRILNGENLGAFVKRSVVNGCRDIFRNRKVRDIDTDVIDLDEKRKRETKLKNITDGLHPGGEPAPEPSDGAVTVAVCLPLCMEQLKKSSPIQWKVTYHDLTLLGKNGCEPTNSELMSLTGFSKTKVSSSLFNGKKALRKCIFERCGVDIHKK